MPKYKAFTDQELFAFICENDQSAFTEIYQRYWRKLFAAAANGLSSPEEAEECVQDIFCSLWRRRTSITLKHSLYSYLAVAVKYQVINRLDSRYRKKITFVDEQDTDLIQMASADERILESELNTLLETAVAQLPEKCRLVFKMSRQEGKSHKQIANELHISEKTVNNHLTKALKDISSNLSANLPAFLLFVYLLGDKH